MNKNEMLNREYEIALDIVKKTIGEEIVNKQMREVIKVGISPRAIRRYGICKYKQYGNDYVCEIELSDKMFKLGEHERINTLIHEIIHTFKDTKGHNYKWQYYANIINNNTDYEITRTNNYEKNGNYEIVNNYKYEIVCCGCGKTSHLCKMSSHRKCCFKNNLMRCRHCGSLKFNVKDLKEGVKIC